MAVNNPTNSQQALGIIDTVTHGNVYVGSTAPNNPFDLSVDKTSTGYVGISVQNNSGAAGAGSVIEVIAEPAAADAYTQYVINGGGAFSTGIDNSDSDSYKITTGVDPSSGTAAIKVTGAGVVSLATPLGLTSGGTNASLTASNGGIFYSTATAGAILAATATANQPLLSGASGAPGWSTATYPGSTTINQLLYSSAANTIGGLSTANNGTLVTSSTGVPSILAGPGTTGNVLQSNAAAAPSFSTATYPSTATGTGTILRADGTNWAATTATYPATVTVSNILYASASNVVSGLATAASGVLITDGSSVPSISNALTISNSATTLATLTCTDAGAGAGPIVDLYRNSGSPAASDVIGEIQFNGQDTGPAKNLYAQIFGQIDLATAGAENARLTFQTQTAGTLTTQLNMLNTGTQVRGNNTNTAPPAGYVGEEIIATVTAAAPVSLTNNTAADLTSISLTPGVWDLTVVASFQTSGTVAGNTQWIAGQNTTSATLGTEITNYIQTGGQLAVSGANAVTVVYPAIRVLVSATTTYYAVVRGGATVTFTNVSAYGKFRALRVG